MFGEAQHSACWAGNMPFCVIYGFQRHGGGDPLLQPHRELLSSVSWLDSCLPTHRHCVKYLRCHLSSSVTKDLRHTEDEEKRLPWLTASVHGPLWLLCLGCGSPDITDTQHTCGSKDTQITTRTKERGRGEEGRWRGELNWSSRDTQEERERKGGERKTQKGDTLGPSVSYFKGKAQPHRPNSLSLGSAFNGPPPLCSHRVGPKASAFERLGDT